jgi:hypothetical protein
MSGSAAFRAESLRLSGRYQFFWGYASGTAWAQIKANGKAQPFHTEGGKAA